MKNYKEATVNYRADMVAEIQFDDLFQNPGSATNISMRDKEWFEGIFLEGENKIQGYTVKVLDM